MSKKSQIRIAEGEAEAILKINQAEAESIKIIKEAKADQSVLTLKSFDALTKVAEGNATKIIVPWLTESPQLRCSVSMVASMA